MKKLLTILCIMGLTGVFAQETTTTEETTADQTQATVEKKQAPQRAERGKRPIPPQMIEKFDKDGDGVLNDEEKASMRQTMKAKMLKKFDKDGDGVLSDDEKATMRKEMKNRRGPEARKCPPPPPPHFRDGKRPMPPQMIERFDKDGDGVLNNEEKTTMRKEMKNRRIGKKHPHRIGIRGERPKNQRAKVAAFFKKFDTDGDGKLSQKEFLKARKLFASRKAKD